MNLSPNFTLQEMTVSQVATRLGIDNTPPDAIIDNLRRLCIVMLEPLRSIVKAPIIVSSGYRCPMLNRAIGGSSGSGHMYGLASDIIVPGVSVRDVCKAIVVHKLPFDQLIDEFGAWVHVSVAAKDSKPRMQQLEARKLGPRGTTYTSALFDR